MSHDFQCYNKDEKLIDFDNIESFDWSSLNKTNINQAVAECLVFMRDNNPHLLSVFIAAVNKTSHPGNVQEKIDVLKQWFEANNGTS